MVSVHGPLMVVSHSHIRSQRLLWGFAPVPPVDHARSTSSCLAHTGRAAKAAPSSRLLGRDSDQASGLYPECLAMASAGQVCFQGSKSNVMYFSITMSFCVLPSEVVGAASDFCSSIPGGSGPCPPLESEITVVVFPCHL